MLFFLLCLTVGIAAVLLAQVADIECAKVPNFQDPVLKSLTIRPAVKRQEDRSIRVPLAQLAQH